jgi:hypothetical protein
MQNVANLNCMTQSTSNAVLVIKSFQEKKDAKKRKFLTWAT